MPRWNSMVTLERLKCMCRWLRWPEKLFALALVAFVVLTWLPLTGSWRTLSGIVATLAGLLVVLKHLRRGVRALLWRLRNRLIVAYVLIAVVPVALILLLAAISCYLITGQVAVYLITSELEERTEGLLVRAREMLSYPRAQRAERMSWLAESLAARFPGGVELYVRDRGEWRYPQNSSMLPPEFAAPEESGLIMRDGRPYIFARVGSGSAEAFALAPAGVELLNNLAPRLGAVSLLRFPVDGARPSPTGRTQAQPPAERHAPAPPPANWFDFEVTWFGLLNAVSWEDPCHPHPYPLVVTSRPSAVLQTLFSRRVDVFQGYLSTALLVVGILFLVFELVALVTGVSLTRTITAAVHNLYEGTRRVTQGDLETRIEVRGNDQLAELSRSFNEMTANLNRLLRVEKEQQRLRSELEIAREVQNQLYPRCIPQVEGLELLARCRPARMVSGDYYDYLALDGCRLAMALADVAGKGISAALLMASIQSSLRTYVSACMETGGAAQKVNGLGAARLVGHLNQQLYANTSAEKYATFYFAVWDPATSRLTYTNAGHLPPVLIRGGRAMRLKTSGTVVGAFPRVDYGEDSIELEQGDLFACFTDGLTEPENEYGEMFGEERLIDILVRNRNAALAEILDAVYAAVEQWTALPEPPDDMTMLIARRI